MAIYTCLPPRVPLRGIAGGEHGQGRAINSSHPERGSKNEKDLVSFKFDGSHQHIAGGV
ncbi:hypothetical protein KKD84_05510 [Patescibacteria group bacterium]|nr:hypothetical protein [Patescibacteria group bacterium]